jgi:CBS domain-containing protein
MPIADVCVRDVAIGSEDITVQDAAQLMRRLHVGNVVVAEERPTGQKVPVGIVTDRYGERAITAGFTGYLTKPIRLADLRSEVERLLLFELAV